MFLRIVFKSFSRNKRRKALAVSMIAISITIIAAMLNIWIDIEAKVAKELRVYGSNIVVKPKMQASQIAGGFDFDPLKSKSFIEVNDLLKLKTIFWRNNIVGFTPYLESKGMVQTAKGDLVEAPITGTWFNNNLLVPTGEKFTAGAKALKPWWRITGRWASDKETANGTEIMVGQSLSKRLGLKAGDKVALKIADQTTMARIAGIISGDDKEEDRIFTPIAIVQRSMNLKGKAGWAEISALTTPDNALARKYENNPSSLSSKEFEIWYCTAFIKSIAFQIEEVVAGSEATPIRQIADSEGAILSKTKYLMVVFAVLAFCVALIGIWGLMSGYVQERCAEVGLSKAIGASGWSIIYVFLAEAFIIGVIGGIFGTVSGYFASNSIGLQIFGRGMGSSLLSVGISLAAAVTVSLFGNISTVISITRLNTKDVLHAR